MSKKLKSIYNESNFWFHVSTTIRGDKVVLIPREDGMNRPNTEPSLKRICVSPTLEQCLVAIPYCYHDIIRIYCTENKIKVIKPYDVFDIPITQEGWICEPTFFVEIGTLKLNKIFQKKVIESVAEYGIIKETKRVYNKWKRFKPWKYVKFKPGKKKFIEKLFHFKLDD